MKLLVRRAGGIEPETLLIGKGLTQGYPLSMVLYGMSLSVLVEQIWVEYPIFLQPWFSDDSIPEEVVAQPKPDIVRIEALGPARVFFLKPLKSHFVQAPGVS